MLTPDRQALAEPAGHGVVRRVVELGRFAEQGRPGQKQSLAVTRVGGAEYRAEQQLDLEGRGGLEDRLTGLERSALPCGHQGAVDLGRLGVTAHQDADLGRLGAIAGGTDGTILTKMRGIHLVEQAHRLAGDGGRFIGMDDLERHAGEFGDPALA